MVSDSSCSRPPVAPTSSIVLASSSCRTGSASFSSAFRSADSTSLDGRVCQVLFVADLFHPIGDLAVEPFLNGDVRHRARGRGAVPVLFAGREPDHVARPNLLDGPAPA